MPLLDHDLSAIDRSRPLSSARREKWSKLSEFLQAARSRRSNAGNGHSQTLGHGGIAELGWVEVKQIDQQAASLRKIEHRAFDDMLVFDPPNVIFDAGILTVDRDRRPARFPHRSGLPPRHGH